MIRKGAKIRKEVRTGVKEAGELVAKSARERLFPARQTNIQDSASRRRLTARKPIRVEIQDQTAWVRAGTYLVSARGAVIRKLAARLGINLERKALWVDPRSGRNGRKSQGYDSRAGLVQVRFSQAPRLAKWAERTDRGQQKSRHTVRMTREGNKILTLGPALEKNRTAIRNLMAAAVARGVLG